MPRTPGWDAGLPFEVTRLTGPSVLGGQNLAIAAKSKKPRAAQAFIEFLTKESSQLALFKDGGYAATRTAVYEHQAIKGKYPYVAVLSDAIEHAKLRPVSRYYARFSEVFRGIVDQAMKQSGQLPDGFVDDLTNALQGR
jgi:multiple sugar transport system substrate-binding protein